MPGRRSLIVMAAAAALLARGAASQAPATAAQPRRTGDLWFDPTQLPAFTGTVERYLLNPGGETDALLFREGPQVVFPPDLAEAVRQAAPPGRPLTVWGIRARSAPVITVLAFAPDADQGPRIVERPYWRLGSAGPQAEAARISASGTVRQPYWSPQGEVVGAVLEDGTVARLPQGVPGSADGVRDLMKAGAKLAVEGPGSVAEAPDGGGRPLRALVIDRLGEAPDAMRPLPAPAAAAR